MTDNTDNQLQIFNFENQQVDIIIIDGEPHFIGKQVCDILGYTNAPDALAKHVDTEDKKTLKRAEFLTIANRDGQTGRGGAQFTTIINESGLYSLILKSQLESAKKFKRWVTSEVLPSIRKTGKYEAKQSREVLIANALIAANEIISELNDKIAALLPKATAYDAVIEKFDNISWRDLCNELKCSFNITEKDVREKLVSEGWIYRVNTSYGKTKYKPYTETLQRDLMVVKDTLCNDGKVRQTNYFTYKGRGKLIDWFAPIVAVD